MQSQQMSDLYPRVLGGQTSEIGRKVTIVGHVITFTQQKKLIVQTDANEDIRVEVIMVETKNENNLSEGDVVEVRGKVIGKKKLQGYEIHKFQSNFNLKDYNETVQLMNKQFRELFYRY